MDQTADVIRCEIEETRSQLTQNLQTLENDIRDKVDNVKSSFRKVTPTYQVAKHPLLTVSGAAVAGFLIGNWLESRRGSHAFRVASSSSFFSKLADTFRPQMQIVKGMAVTAAIQYAADRAKHALPQYESQIDKLVENTVQKLES